jgi:hypothetical protein
MKRLLCCIAQAIAALLVVTVARAQTIPLPEDFPRAELKALCKASYALMSGQYGGDAHDPPVAWRCSHGHALACTPGADGVACSRRTFSRKPLPSMIESCRDYGQLPVSSGAYSFVWDWECKDGKPIIVNSPESAKFDPEGYHRDEWKQL